MRLDASRLHERCQRALLEDEQLAELDSHLRECSVCQSLAARLREVDRLAAAVAIPDLPRGLVARVIGQEQKVEGPVEQKVEVPVGNARRDASADAASTDLLERLGRELEYAKTMRRKMAKQHKELQRAFHLLSKRVPSRSVRHIRMSITCLVGAVPEEDTVLQRFTTEATEPIGCCWVRAVGSGEGSRRSFSDLDRVAALNLDETSDTRVVGPIPAGKIDGGLLGLVMFDPELAAGSVLKWGCQWTWPGLWNRFRAVGEDRCYLDLRDTQKVEYDEVDYKIILPGTAKDPLAWAVDDSLWEPEANVDPQTGRLLFAFNLKKPARQLYEFGFKQSAINERVAHGSQAKGHQVQSA